MIAEQALCNPLRDCWGRCCARAATILVSCSRRVRRSGTSPRRLDAARSSRGGGAHEKPGRLLPRWVLCPCGKPGLFPRSARGNPLSPGAAVGGDARCLAEGGGKGCQVFSAISAGCLGGGGGLLSFFQARPVSGRGGQLLGLALPRGSWTLPRRRAGGRGRGACHRSLRSLRWVGVRRGRGLPP
ncbi:unnamed protein product, partial [Ixodes pacificus]